jgi:hypothetical protein
VLVRVALRWSSWGTGAERPVEGVGQELPSWVCPRGNTDLLFPWLAFSLIHRLEWENYRKTYKELTTGSCTKVTVALLHQTDRDRRTKVTVDNLQIHKAFNTCTKLTVVYSRARSFRAGGSFRTGGGLL